MMAGKAAQGLNSGSIALPQLEAMNALAIAITSNQTQHFLCEMHHLVQFHDTQAFNFSGFGTQALNPATKLLEPTPHNHMGNHD